MKEKSFLLFETRFESSPYQGWYDVRVYTYPEGASVAFKDATERSTAIQADATREPTL